MKVGDLVRYSQEVGDDTDVGLVFEFQPGWHEGDFPDIIHVRLFDGTEVADSDHFFEVVSESRRLGENKERFCGETNGG